MACRQSVLRVYSKELKLYLPAANGHQLTSFISAGHVVQHCSVVDEGIQFTAKEEKKEQRRETEENRQSEGMKTKNEGFQIL